jgi:hypothetical protein
MYYLFDSNLILWRDKYLFAISEKNIPFDENSWFTEPSLNMEDFHFRFLVDEKAPFPDNYCVDPIIQLFSTRFIEILQTQNIVFESYPAILVGKKSKKIIQKEYQVFRLTQVSDCLDLERTFFQDTPIKKRPLKMLVRPEYQKSFLNSGLLMTRISGFERQIIVHHGLKTILEREHITGCQFLTKNVDLNDIFDKEIDLDI